MNGSEHALVGLGCKCEQGATSIAIYRCLLNPLRCRSAKRLIGLRRALLALRHRLPLNANVDTGRRKTMVRLYAAVRRLLVRKPAWQLLLD